MSRIIFHSGPRSVEIHGSEYAYAWSLFDKLYAAMVDVNCIRPQDDGQAALNTAIVMGSPPLQFLACMAGMGDPWFWIEGKDRAWLADVIDQGYKLGVMREGLDGNGHRVSHGWEELAAFLREDAVLPIVTTYGSNFGPVTDLITEGDPEKVRKFVGTLPSCRIGPDNLGELRFKGFAHAFQHNRGDLAQAA